MLPRSGLLCLNLRRFRCGARHYSQRRRRPPSPRGEAAGHDGSAWRWSIRIRRPVVFAHWQATLRAESRRAFLGGFVNGSLRALRSVELDVSCLDNAVRFFTDIWRLTLVAQDGGAAYLRGTEAFHHILVLREGRPTIRRIVLDAVDRAAVERAHTAIGAAGLTNVEAPAALDGPGGGYGFGFEDPEGRNFAIVSGLDDHPEPNPDVPDRPMRLAHVNINCKDADLTCRFLTDVVGFGLSDETKRMLFVRCNRLHNTLVLTRANQATLNHIAFEMPDLDSVMRGAGRMRDNGYPIEWGIGRHGPGNNVFAYFLGPDELPIEYTAETIVLPEDYEPHGPDHWVWPPGRTDRWGISPPISKRFDRIQGLFHFPKSAYRLGQG